MALIAAEELGIPYESVEVDKPATRTQRPIREALPEAGTISTGLAVIAAARDAKNQASDLAADF